MTSVKYDVIYIINDVMCDKFIVCGWCSFLLCAELYNAAISDDEKVIDDLDAAIREMETMVDKQRKNVGG